MQGNGLMWDREPGGRGIKKGLNTNRRLMRDQPRKQKQCHRISSLSCLAAPVWGKCKAPRVCLSEFPSAFSLLLPCLQPLADVGELSSSHCEGRQRRSVLLHGSSHSQANREPGRGAGDPGKQRQRQTPTRQRERERRREEKWEGKRKRRSWLERAQEKRRHGPRAEAQRDKHQQRSSDTKTQGATETQAKAGEQAG